MFWNTPCSSETAENGVFQKRFFLSKQESEHQRRAVLSFKARKQEEHQNGSSGSGSSKQRTPERSSRVSETRALLQEPLAVLQRTPERRSSEHQSGSSANTRAAALKRGVVSRRTPKEKKNRSWRMVLLVLLLLERRVSETNHCSSCGAVLKHTGSWKKTQRVFLFWNTRVLVLRESSFSASRCVSEEPRKTKSSYFVSFNKSLCF